jgi:hypothetical protein
MKSKIYIFITLLVFSTGVLSAQTYGNEWINYTQTYYKFKVYQDGMYRIPISTLTALGFPANVQGANLQLFRDGVELPIVVSNTSVLTGSDYILFYGQKADGQLDKRLYQDTTFQLNPSQNSVSDTAFYFITFNANPGHLRYTALTNSMSSLPAKEAYCWATQDVNYRNSFTSGPSANEGQYQSPILYNLNLSQYQKEGYVKSFTASKDSITLTLPQPYVEPSAPNATLHTTLVGRSYLNPHNIQVYAGATLLADTSYATFDVVRLQRAFSMTELNGGSTVKFYFQPSGIPNDIYGVSKIKVQYPALYDVANGSSYAFALSASNTSRYLEFTNMNLGGQLPTLFNLTQFTMQTGDTSIPGLVRFKIPASGVECRFILQGSQPAAFKSIFGQTAVNFKNFSQTSNQGNYIIITDRRYTNDGNGNDHINAYKVYRNSAAGGSYQATVAYVDDIYNEFGYGYEFSTLAMKNFLQYSVMNPNWVNKPKHAFLIGKGLEYTNYRNYRAANPASYNFYPVPTFGQPGSDVLLTDFTKSDRPQLSIGRLSAFTANDIKVYLDKVKEYELSLSAGPNSVSNKLWRKKVLHIAGATDPVQLLPIEDALKRQAKLIEKPMYGASTVLVTKSSSPEAESVNNATVDSMINSGSGIVQFFGHSSASTIDYGLDFPERYTNAGKYPIMIANGCGAGNIFLFTGQKYLSERFVLTPNAGTIGFLASVNTGFSGYLGLYTDSLYGRISNSLYNKSIGEQINSNINALNSLPNFSNDFLFRMHTEQILFNGDPAIKLNNATLPDYAIELADVSMDEGPYHSGLDSIAAKITFSNLGLYTADSVEISVRRKFADASVNTIYKQKVPGFSYQHVLNLKIPALGEIGMNNNELLINIDRPGSIAEISETNNAVVKPFAIRNAGLVPVYPTEFSIVSDPNIILKASTLNPFAQAANYILQIDTTEKFNSSLLQTSQQMSEGGLVKWQPSLAYEDSVVYYWRTALDDGQQNWLTSSFIFINQSLPGWNQSHYFQFNKDDYNSIYLDSASRRFTYTQSNQLLQVQNTCMYGAAPFTYDWPDYLVKMNGRTIYTFGCDPYPGYSSLQFVVIDSLTGEPWLNRRPDPNVALGRFGSFSPCRITNGGVYEDPFFEFSFLTTAGRKAIMDFIDSIPAGHYYMMQPRLCVGSTCGTVNSTFIRHWKADTTSMGSGVSLYHKIYQMGFTAIDSFYKNRPMIFWAKKGSTQGMKQIVGDNSTVKLYGEFNYKVLFDEAKVVTPLIGPASSWNDFKKSSFTYDLGAGDKTTYSIYGITANNTTQLLATVAQDTSLSFIDPAIYPYLRVQFNSEDVVYRTPEQLKYWRIYYTPVPEAALNPASLYTVAEGASPNTKKIKLAIENLTDVPMDSILVSFAIYDRFNVKTVIATKRFAPLPGSDTIHIEYEINTEDLYSNMKFEVEVNPNKDQLEDFHPNNFAIRSMSLIDPTLPLPVTLKNFTVVENNCSARIEWSTSDEVNFSHFDIERRKTTDFAPIATIMAQGTEGGVEYYTYTDLKPENAIYSYRLKMVDVDQKFQYSSTKSLNLQCNSEAATIQLYPNPASEYTNLMIASESQAIYSISVVNAMGQVLYQTSQELDHETKVLNLPVRNLPSGIYSVIVKDDGATQQVFKLTKH